MAEGPTKKAEPAPTHKHEEKKEAHSLSPQKPAPKPKKKLELVSFVGEINICKELIVRYNIFEFFIQIFYNRRNMIKKFKFLWKTHRQAIYMEVLLQGQEGYLLQY